MVLLLKTQNTRKWYISETYKILFITNLNIVKTTVDSKVFVFISKFKWNGWLSFSRREVHNLSTFQHLVRVISEDVMESWTEYNLFSLMLMYICCG